LKDIVQAMAEATGRQGRLRWKTAKAEEKQKTFHRQLRYAACIACCREDALVEARVMQTALSKRSGRRVSLSPSGEARASASQSCSSVVNSRPSGAAAAASVSASVTASASGSISASLSSAEQLASSRGEDAEADLIEESESLVLLLSRNVLHDPEVLVTIARAIRAHKPIVPVLLQGRGYDFAAARELLSDLRAGLAPEELAVFEEMMPSLRAARRGLARLRSSAASVQKLKARGAQMGQNAGRLTAAQVTMRWLTTRRAEAPQAPFGSMSAGDFGGHSAALAARFDEVQGQLCETISNLIAVNWDADGGRNQLAAAVEDIKRRLHMHHLRRAQSESSRRKEQPAPQLAGPPAPAFSGSTAPAPAPAAPSVTFV